MERSILLLILIRQFACNTEGHRGTSRSIQESKDRGTFVAEYEVKSSDDEINTLMKEQVQEVFIEYGWFVKPDKPLVDTSYFNIGIKLRDKNIRTLGGINEQFQIGLDSGALTPYHTSFHNHSKDGMTIFMWDVTDTIIFKVYENEIPIGDLSFIKK